MHAATSPFPLRRSAAPLAVAVAYALVAATSLALTQGADGVAAMWPASGVLLAGMLRLDRRGRAACLAFAALGSVAVNVHAGNGGVLAIGFTLANMVEAAVGAALLRRWGLDRPRFTRARHVGRFCLAAVAAAAVSTAIAAATFGPDPTFALGWFATVALGMLIVAPPLMIGFGRGEAETRALMRTASPVVALLLLTMVAVVTAAVFGQQRYPILFLPLVALLAATWRLGPFGAAAGIALIAVIGTALTAMGHGPIQLSARGATEASFFLQFYLLTLFATALPFGARLTQQRRLAADLAESERMHRLLADSSTDVILRLSLEGVALYCSPAVRAVLGYSPEQTVGATPIDQVHRDDRAAVDAAWSRAVAGGAPESIAFRHRRPDGSFAWLDVAYRRVETEAGGEIVARARDIGKRRAAELAAEEATRRTREANRLLGMAERAAQVGHWRIDLVADTLFWSPEVFRIHGLPQGVAPPLADAIGFYHPDDRDEIARMVERTIADGDGFDFEARIRRADGTVRHVASRGQAELGYDGVATAVFGIIQDVTARVEVERELDAARRAAEQAAANAIRLVDVDALTGVASRRRALAALDEAIVAAEAEGASLALAIFDIDHFKAVNDRHGHPAGDAVLRRVARAASHAVRPTDLVGRLGGEEFAVILPGAEAGHALQIADAVRQAVAASAEELDAGPPVTISIGVAAFAPGLAAAALLGEADRALYDAKGAGRNAARLAA